MQTLSRKLERYTLERTKFILNLLKGFATVEAVTKLIKVKEIVAEIHLN